MPKVELSLEHAKELEYQISFMVQYVDDSEGQIDRAFTTLREAIDYADAKQDMEKDNEK